MRFIVLAMIHINRLENFALMRTLNIFLLAFLAMSLFSCARVPVSDKPQRIPSVSEGDAYDLFSSAEHMFSDQRYDDALMQYQTFINTYPDDKFVEAALMKLGAIHAIRHEDEKAIHVFQRVVDQFPYGLFANEAQIRKLESLYSLEQFDEVAASAMTLLKRRWSDHERKRLSLLAADSQMAGGFYTDAAYYYFKAYELIKDDKTEEIYAKLKSAVAKLGEEQISLLLENVTDEKVEGLFLYQLAVVLAVNEKYDDALDILALFLESHLAHELSAAASELMDTIAQRYVFEPFTIGCVLPLSGPYQIYGQRALNGIEMALEKYRAVNGEPPFKIIVKDTLSDPVHAVEAVRFMAEAKVGAILGPMATAEAAASEAQSMGIPIIVFTQKDHIPETGPYVFRNFITPKMQAASVVSYAVEELGLKKFAILYPNEKYGITYMNLFWDEVISKGGDVVGVEAYDPDKTDFADPIKKLTGLYYDIPSDLKLKGGAPADLYDLAAADEFIGLADILKDPVDRVSGLFFLKNSDEEDLDKDGDEPEPVVDFDAVFIPDAPKKAGLIIPQLTFHDVKDVYLIGTNLWHSKSLIKMSRRYVQGALIPDGFFAASDAPVVKDFTSGFMAVFNETPGIIEATAYDSAMMLFEVMEKPQVKLRRTIKHELLNLGTFSGTTGLTSFDFNGNANKDLYMMRIKGRRFVELKRTREKRFWHR